MKTIREKVTGKKLRGELQQPPLGGGGLKCSGKSRKTAYTLDPQSSHVRQEGLENRLILTRHMELHMAYQKHISKFDIGLRCDLRTNFQSQQDPFRCNYNIHN